MTKKEQSPLSLNCLKFGIIKPFSVRSFFEDIGQFFRNLKYAKQRITRGFCDSDVWNLDTYYTKLMIVTLQQLKETTNGYPGVDIWQTPEAWDNYLDEIVEHLTNSLEEFNVDEQKANNYYFANVYHRHFENKPEMEIDREILNNWNDLIEKAYKSRVSERNKALEMMQESWDHLWD